MDDLDILSKLYAEKVIQCERYKDRVSKMESDLCTSEQKLFGIYRLIMTEAKVPKRIKTKVNEIFERK